MLSAPASEALFYGYLTSIHQLTDDTCLRMDFISHSDKVVGCQDNRGEYHIQRRRIAFRVLVGSGLADPAHSTEAGDAILDDLDSAAERYEPPLYYGKQCGFTRR